jgi:glutamate formiminotransferase
MRKIVECVPNISEGRDEKIINACADAVRKVKVLLLMLIPENQPTGLYFFVGDPDSIVEGAFQFAKKAYELIDMTRQHGEHPRMGAVDVVPFVPVAGVTTKIAWNAQSFWKKVGKN